MSYFPWHATVRQQLHAAAEQLPHALLFNIEPGCGHEDFIWAFAKYLLCLIKDSEGFACGKCRSCEVFQSAAHPDFTHINTPEDKKVIGVDQVRSLNHFLELSRSYSPARVVLISNAETMNVNAANSLLKSLEEPAGHTHILLVTTHVQDLLPTIRSRCQQIRMPLPGRQAALDWLQAQGLQKTQNQTTEGAENLLTLASGRPLYAVTLSSGDLPLKQQEWAKQLLEVLEGRIAMSAVSAQWAKEDNVALLNWQQSLVQSMLRDSFLATKGQYGEVHAKFDLLLKHKNLWQLNDGLIKLKALSTHPLNAQLFAENMISLWQK